MSYQHVKGKGRPALPMRTDPADVERLERVIVHMKRDPYVMGQVSVAGAARAALKIGLAELERRYGIEEAKAAE